MKSEKPVGTQLFGQVKKEPAAKASDGGSKTTGSKQASKKAAQKPQEPKKKVDINPCPCMFAIVECLYLYLLWLITMHRNFIWCREKEANQRSTNQSAKCE